MTCPYCNSVNIKKKIISYNKVVYFICIDCDSLYQDLLKSISINNYKNFDWKKTVDPDGKYRDLTNERYFKIKNWYGKIPKFVSKLNPGKILDIGAGLGYLLSTVNSDWEKHCIEISAGGINHIKSEYPEVNIKCQELDENLYEPEYFDVIILYHVIEHLEEPIKILKIIKKILKPNGYLILGTPNSTCFAFKIFEKNFRLLDPTHLSIISEKQLKRTLIKLNFAIEYIEKPYFKTDYFNLKNLLKIFNTKRISPPFYGNIITTYCKKII
jgi:2-polyprenyl-3-methyl-5-hydroxy-6-metoxy-1,4-benzoquinol methylase